ncbi:MAG: threonine synthase, partial [Proteobacteria bacterium]|nr:threonine synthase [Pseudomonadota bacterium]
YAYDQNPVEIDGLFSELKAAGKFRIGDSAYRGLQKHYCSGTATETETYQVMKKVGAKYDILVCPHTAVGLHVAENYLGDLPMISLATAHPAKFPVAVEKATDIKPGLPDRVSHLFLKSERVTKLPNRLEIIKETIKERRAT